MHFSLDPQLLLGVATAPTQIEGGTVSHTWSDWAEKGHIKDGSSPSRANHHYVHVAEDSDLLKELGVQVYRFGIEWARIEPECGQFDEDAVHHYRDEISGLLKRGIRPLMTLHHFTNPLWFEQRGAFEKPDNIPLFLQYVEYAVRSFGDLVEDYVTVNEPNVYAVNGYFAGDWPPGKRNVGTALRVMSVMVSCHIQAYSLIHRIREEMGFSHTMVGFANHLCVFTPANPKRALDRIATKFYHRLFQGSLSLAATTGVCHWPISPIGPCAKGLYADFHGINYYTRYGVSGLHYRALPHVPKNDLGWEIYPDGIVECCRMMHNIAPLPIYITENGTCDNDDSFRSRYLFEHLRAISESGLPVLRYYHWCFLDNFEWIEGESARFGIVHVDYPTQRREVKNSGRFYGELIQNHGVTEDMYDRFVAPANYRPVEE